MLEEMFKKAYRIYLTYEELKLGMYSGNALVYDGFILPMRN